MFYYSVPLTLIFLVFMVISMVITKIVSRKNLQYATERQETIADLTGVVEEYYNGRNVIKAFNHGQESLEQVAASAERNRIASQKADFLVNCVNPLIRLLTRMAYVVIAIISGHAMLNGTMTVGVVQAFFQYIPDGGAADRGVLHDQLPAGGAGFGQPNLRAAGRDRGGS